ncbi:hypothetical protein FWK35_00022806 [Aphis craccivora]|uniref:Uncharacterized protein n=1 Tax=Aphis craccivora TaxID=307492 RepID=A0A6G0VY07_APHCR|nr:hypothetical protein FWK35_00022806 [Aphis craccivora]
MFQVFNTKEVR